MKKKFLIVLMGVLMLLSAAGCSCAPVASLDFSSSWNSSPAVGYSETLTYTGEYSASYTDQKFSYVKKENLTDDICKINENSYKNATYTIKTEVVANNSFTEAESDILQEYNSYLIKVTTSFSVDVNLLLNGKDEVNGNDESFSVVYLCKNTDGFAPIYSKSNSKSTILIVNKGVASTSIVENTTEFIYNEKNYVSKVSYIRDGNEENNQTKTYKYTKGSLIDNSALTFVMRNLELSVDSSRSFKIPALAENGKAKSAGSKCLAEKDIELVNFYNGQNLTVKTNCYQIGFSGSSSGVSKLFYYQTAESKNAEQAVVLQDRNYLIRFIEILPVYGEYGFQGSLVFNLSSVA